MNSTIRLQPKLTWIDGLFVMYRAQQYDITWSAIVGGIIREFAISDRQNMDFSQLAKHILDSPVLRQTSGDNLLGVLRDVEVLRRRRDTGSPHAETTETPPYDDRRRRRVEWAVGTVNLGMSLLDYAIAEYYASRLNREIGTVIRMIVSLYMVADKRVRLDDFEKFVDEASGQVSEKDQIAIAEGWQVFLDKRQQCQRRRRKSKKAS